MQVPEETYQKFLQIHTSSFRRPKLLLFRLDFFLERTQSRLQNMPTLIPIQSSSYAHSLPDICRHVRQLDMRSRHVHWWVMGACWVGVKYGWYSDREEPKWLKSGLGVGMWGMRHLQRERERESVKTAVQKWFRGGGWGGILCGGIARSVDRCGGWRKME